MRIVVQKADLIDALGIVGRAVPARSSIPVLSGVLVEAKEAGIWLSSTDMEISIRTPLVGRVETPGAAVLPGRMFADIAKTLGPREARVEQRPGESQVEITCGEADFVLHSLPAADFPQFPVFPVEKGFKVGKQAFLQTVDRVAPSASRDETRPVLTGVLIMLSKNSVKMVGTDSYRLSVKETPVETTVAEKVQVIVPARTLVELSRIGAVTQADTMTVVPTDNQVLFEVGGVSVISRLIDGQFPNYRQLMPDTFEYEVVVDRQEFTDSVKRVGLLAQKSAPVRLRFSTNNLAISAQSQDVGRAHESLPVRYEGDDIEIGFNPEYLVAGAQAVGEESVYLKFISPLRPGLLKGESDDFLYLIMPIRLND